MIGFFANLFTSFILGLLTPLTAVCVLPLYPAFLAYLSDQMSGREENKKLPLFFGILISVGVIVFMTLLGLVFTTVLQVSLTKVVGIVSPIAFGILFVLSILLIMDYDLGKFFPQKNVSDDRNPLITAFLYGFFFGAVVVPCNPGFIAALFAKTLTTIDFVGNMLNFLAFGFGISFPLIVFSLLSLSKSMKIITVLVNYKRKINLIAGIFMMAVSLYYLIIVFKVQELIL